MKKTLLIGTIFLCLTGCDKSTAEAAEVASADEEKFDLKGMYPGMSKSQIEKIVGKITCGPSDQIVANLENTIVQAEKNLAQNAYSGQPPSDAMNSAKQIAEQLVKIKNSGQIEVARVVYKEQLDTVCTNSQDSGQTYVNRPVLIEVGLKNGRAKSITLDVMGATTDNLLDAMIIKYKWLDGTQNQLEQRAIRMQRGMSLMQGMADGRNNILNIMQSPHIPNAARISMVDVKFHKAVITVQMKIKEKETGAGDA